MARWHRRTPRRRDRRPVPSPPPGYWPAARQPSAARLAAHLTGRAVAGYARWVARAPETRGLGTGLVALYPAGEITHLAGADPVMVGLFGAPAALAAWTGTWKAHRSRRYSAAAAATAAGVPAWLATAAATGITHPPVLLGYTAAAAAGWSAITWSDVLRHRRAWRAQKVRWQTIASAAGLQNSRLISAEDTRTGQKFRVDVRATGTTPSKLARGDLAERIAGILALPAERVRVARDRAHGGVIIVTVQTEDPWAMNVTHPALDVTHVPARRSVMAAPLVLGTDPDTGADLTLTVYDDQGAWHTFIVAATGGGKTTLYSNLAEQLTARTDVLVWAIDLRKGTIPFYWRDALDACAGLDSDGNPEYGKALAILDWGSQIIRLRSAKNGGKNHIPTPDDPAIRILIDEGDTLLGADSPIAHKAKPLVADILRGGRSAGVGLDFAGQRGVIQYTGSKDTHANAGNKIVLRVQRAAEMNNIVPGWELAGMPDMSTYAPGVAGVALVVGPTGQWHAGRVRDLHDLDAAAQLAARRGRPAARLPAGIAQALPGYAERPAEAAPGGAAILTLPARHGGHEQAADAAARDGRSVVTRLSRDLVGEVEARLSGMPAPPAEPIPLAALIAARNAISAAEDNDPAVNQAIPIPEHVADPILALLGERGDAGARRDEIVALLHRPESSVKRWLRILRDHGRITTSGATSAARYYLPEHAPDAGEDTPGNIDGTPADDDAA